MTVPAKIPADTHVGNGVTTQFAYSFLCFDKVDFKVFIDLALVDPSEYTVDGLGNPSGGMVTFTTPPANGVSVILRLDVVLDRQTNYQFEGDFLSPVVNRDFDRLWLSQQSQQVDLNAAVRFPPGESVSFLPAVNTRKGKALVFNATTGEPEPSVDDYNDQAANAAASAAAADQAKQDAQTAAGNSSDAADAAAQSATDAANAAASVDPQGLSTDRYGPTAPSITWPGMTWADSGTNTLWRRNAANDGWDYEHRILGDATTDLQWLGTPIGVELPFHPNAPLPPTNDPRFRYVILTAGLAGSGGYNEGVLTDETVTGSDPTITATATVSLVGSPLDGQQIDLINTSRVFLRPGPAAGPIVDSQNAAHAHTGSAESGGAHTHTIYLPPGTAGSTYAGPVENNGSQLQPGMGNSTKSTVTASGGAHSHTLTINNSGGNEAHPRYIPRVYLMRIL